jgi:hypothetical protein
MQERPAAAALTSYADARPQAGRQSVSVDCGGKGQCNSAVAVACSMTMAPPQLLLLVVPVVRREAMRLAAGRSVHTTSAGGHGGHGPAG